MHKLSVRTQDQAGKWSIAKTVELGVYDCIQPTADFSFVPVCIDQPVEFINLSSNIGPGAIFDWDINNDGIVDYTNTGGNISHQYTQPGTYEVKLKITHNVACRDSIFQTVVFPYVNLGNDTTIYSYQTIILDAGPGFSSYLWSDGSTFQTLTVAGPIVGEGEHTYHVTVTDAIGCSDSDTITITVIPFEPPPVPENRLVENLIIPGGASDCFDATETITAYNLTVQTGGSIVLIAGENILMFEQIMVESGGYLHAYISTEGIYCFQPAGMLASEEQQSVVFDVTGLTGFDDQLFKVYPNPTNSTFNLELTEAPDDKGFIAEIYNTLGHRILHKEIHGSSRHEFDLSAHAPGIYLVRVIHWKARWEWGKW
jgi:hypothetical protein